MKKIRCIIILILVSILAVIVVSIVNKINIISKVSISKKQLQTTEFFSYIVYDSRDEKDIKIVISINTENGLEYIKKPDGDNINANGKNSISIDYSVKKDEKIKFEIKEIGKKASIQTINMSEEELKKKSIEIEEIIEKDGVKIIKINNKINLNGFNIYYKIGQKGEWKQGDEEIEINVVELIANGSIDASSEMFEITVKAENLRSGYSVQSSTKEVDIDVSTTIIPLYGFDTCYGGGFAPWYERNIRVNMWEDNNLLWAEKTQGGDKGIVGGVLTNEKIDCVGAKSLCILYNSITDTTPNLNVTTSMQKASVGDYGPYNVNNNNYISGKQNTTPEGTLVTYDMEGEGLDKGAYRVGFMLWGGKFKVSIKKIWMVKYISI